MTPNEMTPREPELREQLERLLGFFRRALRFWLLPLVALLAGGIALGIFLRLRVPQYRSETVILYVQRGSTGEGSDATGQPRSVTARLKELLLSRPKLERVVSEFDLYPSVRRTYGDVEAVEELKKHIDFRAPGGDAFSIAFEGSSPAQAQRVTVQLARLVIDGDSELRSNQAKVGLEFLVGEKQATGTQLLGAEQALASFMAQHPRFALDATPLANGAAIRASLGAGDKPATRAGGQAWPRRVREASPGTAVQPSGAPAEPAMVGGPPPSGSGPDAALARAALAAARENLAEQLAHYTAAHPDVRAAEAAVQRANQRLAALPASEPVEPRARAAASVAPEPERPSPGLAPLRAAPAAAPAEPMSPGTQTVVELETRWLTLTRAVTEARQRQDQIESQLFKADILASSESGGHGVQVDVIDPAFLPQRPMPPGPTMIAAMFLAGSLLLGVLGALVLAAIDERLFRGRDVTGIVELLVEVPRAMKGRRTAHVAS